MPSSGMLRRAALVRIDVPPKRRFLQEPHGVISQKTALFMILSVEKFSNEEYFILQYMKSRKIM
jgi:hypothetical protein